MSHAEKACADTGAGEPLAVDIAVVGAGAAGLWAAARAARGGCSVALVEKTRRTGTKVLASGGTRCNLTTTLGSREAARLFGRAGERFLRHAFRVLPPEQVRSHFHALGVPTVEAPLEKVFPKSQSAVEVRDALERDARAAGARILLESPVAAIAPAPMPAEGAADARAGAGGWVVHIAGGASVRCAKLLLCPGGASYPRTGTTGDGYGWLRALDLEVVPPVPALVPLTSPAAWVRELTGIALQDVDARLLDAAGRPIAQRARPVLFTHHGVSGPGAMDLSGHVARALAAGRAARADAGEAATAAPGGGAYAGRVPPADGARAPFHIALDLLPGLERDALRAALIEAAGRPGAPGIARCLPGALPRRLLRAACAQAGLPDSNPPANRLDRAARHRLVEALKGLRVPIDGTLGFDKAEVTAGGLALPEVDPGTMRVKRFANLYAIGELLDLDGPIGGLSFQAAFATAEVAAAAATRLR